MSYQFEDDSALEELLNQQLDRRKQQTMAGAKQSRNPSRPATGLGVKPPQQQTAPSGFPSAPRPSTAQGSSLRRQQLEAASESNSSLPPGSDALEGQKAKSLSSWLQGGSSAGKWHRDEEKVSEPASSSQRFDGEENLIGVANREVPRARFVSPAGTTNLTATTKTTTTATAAAASDLDDLLSPTGLQELSKQRLIQVILEELAPRLIANQKGLASGELATRELAKLEQELQSGRNRAELSAMRHEEQLKLERQKWQQINQQLEKRLAAQELEMGQLVVSQREHLGQLAEQYQGQLTRLSEMFDQRLNDEKRRFAEILEGRESLHKLELEAKLNVNCDLAKLNTVQVEWRRMLEMTINQLSDHYKSVEALLEKQALQVNGSNSDLAKRAQRLCDQYDNYDKCQARLAQVAMEWSELMPGLAQVQARSGSLLDGLDEKLAKLSDKLEELARSEKQLEQTKLELGALSKKLDEDKFKLALDSNRVSMKEERLNELLNQNSTMETQLSKERKSLVELQAQAHSKRCALDERFADLKEQNYSLHLLRKRLTAQKEELLKNQLEFAEERKSSSGNKAQMEDEMKRLNTLKVRVHRELDQLRRLQRSLVCSLCMSRLFGGATETINDKREIGVQRKDLQPNEAVLHKLNFLPDGVPLGHSGLTLAKDYDDLEGELARRRDNDIGNANELTVQRQQAELERSRLADESRYVEQLFAGS